ncbi:MAG: glycosyltransferase family 39 protein [Magnetococcus sp. DMHC-6]
MKNNLVLFFEMSKHPLDRRFFVLAFGLGLLGLVVRIWLYQQPFNTDDTNYFNLVVHGRSSVDHLSLRSFFLWSIGLFVHLFGESGTGYYAAIYFHGFLSFLGVWLISSAIYNPRVTLFIVFLWVTSYPYIMIDTRLLSDNVGISLTLIGLAGVIRASAFRVDLPVLSIKTTGWLAFGSGLFFVAGYSARENLVVYSLVALLIVFMSSHRRKVLPWLFFGLSLGVLLEWSYFYWVYGDPWIRIKILSGYKGLALGTAFDSSIESLPAPALGGEGGSSGASFISILFLALMRYPKMLLNTGSAEIFFHFFGWLGMFVWMSGWRDRLNWVLVFAIAIPFGLLAFAMSSWDPPVPIMRESVRYYLMSAVWFYMASVTFFLALAKGVASPTFVNWWNRWPLPNLMRRLVGLAPVMVLLAIPVLGFFNLWVASQFRDMAKNGLDGYVASTSAIKLDREANGRAALYYSDGGAARVIKLFLPMASGWSYQKLPQGSQMEDTKESLFSQGGYLLLDWARNNQSDLTYGDKIKKPFRNFDHLFQYYPIVFRHRNKQNLTEVLWVGPERLDRKPVAIGSELPWSAQGDPLTLANLEIPSQGTLYSGSGLSTDPSASGGLAANRLFQIVFRAQSMDQTPAGIQGWLYRWGSDAQKGPIRHYLGEAYTGSVVRELSMWSYLSEATSHYRIVLKSLDKAVKIVDLQAFLLETVPEDRLLQKGDAW